MRGLSFWMVLTGLLVHFSAAGATREFIPNDDAKIVEKLAPRVFASARTGASVSKANVAPPLSIKAAAQAAQRAISVARETGDPRYLGQAQALLGPWWDKPNAPIVLAVLQATIQQSRHEFDAARILLQATLNREPKVDAALSQGWLTLATIERLSGRYAKSLEACARVAQGGVTALAIYATACELETQSLLGQHESVRGGFGRLIKEVDNPSTRSWILSLAAENEERAGRDDAALKSYLASLSLQEDTYTALAASDLLLRKNRPAQALSILEKQPMSDAVLIRRAQAKKLLKDPQWQAMLIELNDRFDAMKARGDDPRVHAREQALVNLWLKEDSRQALVSAKLNLSLQKEPVDWWIALQSASQLKDQTAIAVLRKEFAATGLRDARFEKSSL